MFSTTAIIKNSKFTGKIVGTHQRLDQAARRSLSRILPKNRYFPTITEILHFEGSRGPDGLKRKSPGIDEPSHMLINTSPAVTTGQIDARSVPELIVDHRYNLVEALKKSDNVRAAFEAAWLAHMITDGLTPAHHFPLSDIKNELMTDKEMVKIFGEPLKGIMHGRNLLETMRNNWLYWGAGGCMSKHIAYEYGVLTITAAMTPHMLEINLTPEDLQETNILKIFQTSLKRVQELDIYTRFLEDNWTAAIATETKEILLPAIVKAITLGWYSAVAEAYQLAIEDDSRIPRSATESPHAKDRIIAGNGSKIRPSNTEAN